MDSGETFYKAEATWSVLLWLKSVNSNHWTDKCFTFNTKVAYYELPLKKWHWNQWSVSFYEAANNHKHIKFATHKNALMVWYKLDESTARRQLKSPRSLSGRSSHLGHQMVKITYDLENSNIKVMAKVKPIVKFEA